jgi:hypothetical protein
MNGSLYFSLATGAVIALWLWLDLPVMQAVRR